MSCEALGFVNQNKMKDFNLASLNIDYFNSKDCNILGFPNTDNVNNFISEKFDLIINLSEEENLMYDYILERLYFCLLFHSKWGTLSTRLVSLLLLWIVSVMVEDTLRRDGVC